MFQFYNCVLTGISLYIMPFNNKLTQRSFAETLSVYLCKTLGIGLFLISVSIPISISSSHCQ